jgi:hypothetical protein
MKDVTPEHMRCTYMAACPSIHELEDGRLLIVGKRTNVSAEVLATMDLATEEAIIIDKALLSTIIDDAVSSSQAEIERLKEALKPFADKAANYDPDPDEVGDDGDQIAWDLGFTIGDLRRARAALSGQPGESA